MFFVNNLRGIYILDGRHAQSKLYVYRAFNVNLTLALLNLTSSTLI
jgi:hypothetical protein